MMKYTEYSMIVAMKENEKDYSWINLFATEAFTQDEFVKIVTDTFNKHKNDVVSYSLSDLLDDNLLSLNEYSELEDKGFESLNEVGENRFPDNYKYINTLKLCKLITKEHPEFSLSISKNYIKFDSIYF